MSALLAAILPALYLAQAQPPAETAVVWAASRTRACTPSPRCIPEARLRGADCSRLIASIRFDFPEPFAPIGTFSGRGSRVVSWNDSRFFLESDRTEEQGLPCSISKRA
jgi:hypothetical protein